MLKALANPSRLKIVAGLIKDKCNVSAIQKKLGLPQSTVSQHLNILKSRGIIMGVRDGVRVCYKVVDKKAAAIVRILED
ncbi:MAG: winged helix-turn-helix transcriptional regulator [Elusimicrobia bacterium]|nr:winged helix-turn-helix transcriptional regulator [Elusimicrobiota bacterium]